MTPTVLCCIFKTRFNESYITLEMELTSRKRSIATVYIFHLKIQDQWVALAHRHLTLFRYYVTFQFNNEVNSSKHTYMCMFMYLYDYICSL